MSSQIDYTQIELLPDGSESDSSSETGKECKQEGVRPKLARFII